MRDAARATRGLVAERGGALRAGMSRFVLCGLLFIWGEPCDAQSVYSTERRFGPIRLSQNELVELVGRLQALAGMQDATVRERNIAWQTLTVSDGRNSVEISEDISVEALDAAPEVVTTVRYSGRYGSGVIQEIQFSFSDLARRLTVSGSSRDQVEGAAEVAAGIVGEAETVFGGSRRRSAVGAMVVAVSVWLILGANRAPVTPLVGLAMFAAGLLLSGSVLLFPWRDWFPGVAVYGENASFMVRYGPRISLLAALITIVGGALGVVRWGRRLATEQDGRTG